MPNTVAYLTLYSWPIVVFVLFKVMPRAHALIWSIFGGYLLLPHGIGINLPLLPAFDKTLLPALSAAIMYILVREAPTGRRHVSANSPHDQSTSDLVRRPNANAHKRISRKNTASVGDISNARQRFGGNPIETILFLLLVITPFLTVMQNTEPYAAGPRFLPGLRFYDAFSIILSTLVAILPFLLARRYLAHPNQHVLLLRGLCLAGLLYSLPTLFEVRMSPQLSRWIFGFLAQSFGQTMRDGGFRPVVFLEHGLWLAIFMAMALLAAFILWRHQDRRINWFFIGGWLLLTLLLSHSLGGLVVALMLLPAVILLPVRGQMYLAAGIASIVLFYPLLRGADIIPVKNISALARNISEERAGSLEFRLKNEDILLSHANAKPLAGWGGWGRSRVYDQRTGRDISITDGVWIIIVGSSGWLGYIGRFGLLTLPIILLALRQRRFNISLATSGLCLVLAANLTDMIPNATLTPVTWLISGALMGRVNLGTDHSSANNDPRISRGHKPDTSRRRRSSRITTSFSQSGRKK